MIISKILGEISSLEWSALRGEELQCLSRKDFNVNQSRERRRRVQDILNINKVQSHRQDKDQATRNYTVMYFLSAKL